MEPFLVLMRTLGRPWRTHPGSSALVVAVLGAGIALNTFVFSFANALLLQPLDAVRAHEMVRIGARQGGSQFLVVSPGEYETLRVQLRGVEGIAAFRPNATVFDLGGEPRETDVEVVSSDYFDVLGLALRHGAGFPNDAAERARAVVLGDALWRTVFNANPAVAGTAVSIAGQTFAVGGVAPPGFRGSFPGFDAQVWVALEAHDAVLPNRGSFADDEPLLNLVARRRAGVSLDLLQDQLDAIAARLATAPDAPQGSADRGFSVAAARGAHPAIAAVAAPFVALLQGVAVALLLVACGNVGAIMIASVATRAPEFAVQRALGATRWTLLRGLLTEAAALAFAGGVLGLALARVLAAMLAELDVPGLPIDLRLPIDARVVAFALGTSALATLASGTLPGLRAGRARALETLRSENASPGLPRSLRALVVGQIAVSFVLVCAGGLVGRSLAASARVDLGFTSDSVLVAAADPGAVGRGPEDGRAYWASAADAVRADGFAEVALTLFVPLGGRADRVVVGPVDSSADARSHYYNLVDESYFDLLRVPVVVGRAFSARDDPAGAPAAIVNEALAESLFPGNHPVGRALAIDDAAGRRFATVVGVVPTVSHRRAGEPPTPVLFLPWRQWPRGGSDLSLLARPGDLVEGHRRFTERMRAVDPEVPVQVNSMAQLMEYSLLVPRAMGVILGFSGLAGLLLVAAGVFGILGHIVTRRAREIAVRRALGASRVQGAGLIVKGCLRLAAWGWLLGLVPAHLVARTTAAFLYGVESLDARTLLLAGALLLAVALAAGLGPARRAVAGSPATSLR